MSYREVIAVMAGASRFLLFQSNMHMRAAWHVAAFDRMKKMPRLEHVLQKQSGRRRAVQTPEQQAMVAEQWLRVNQARGLVKVVKDGTRHSTGRGSQSLAVT